MIVEWWKSELYATSLVRIARRGDWPIKENMDPEGQVVVGATTSRNVLHIGTIRCSRTMELELQISSCRYSKKVEARVEVSHWS